MRIKKVSQTTPIPATVVNAKSNSQTNTYSCDYINNLSKYSTTETVCGTWINGKPLYRKTYTINSLPNASTSIIDSGLTDVFVTNIYGIAYRTTGSTPYQVSMINTSSPNGVTYAIQAYYVYDRNGTDTEKNKIYIETGTNRSTYSGVITLEYTKTTD